LYINIAYFSELNKTFFSLYFYKLFKLKSGYITLNSDGIFIHLTDRKAIFLPLKNIKNSKNVLKFYKDFHFNDLYIIIETNLENIDNKLPFLMIYNYVFNTYTRILNERKPYVKLKSAICFSEDNKQINLYLKSKIYVNLLVIIINLIKTALEKIINAKRKQKQQIY
jgi:hypothetical protein